MSHNNAPRSSRRFQLTHRAVSAAVFIAALAGSTNAHADTRFFSVLNTDYGFELGCIVCHATALGNDDAPQPFGVAVKELGITQASTDEAFRAALATLEAQGSDVDGDGFPDFQELREAGDPSDPSVGPGGAELEPIVYGCLSVARASRQSAWPLLSALLVAVALLRSRRRRG